MSSGPWFVAPKSQWNEGSIRLDAEESHHALKVLRVGPTDVVTVTDGSGSVARCSVTVDEGVVEAVVIEATHHPRSQPELVVYQGAGKANKADAVIERLAELGAAEAWVYESMRSVVRWDPKKKQRLDGRWGSIARAAAKQSRNPWMVRTGAPLSWAEFMARIESEPLAVVLWEEASLPLRTVLAEGAERVALVVGPEGGLDRGEAEALAAAGAQLVSLGPMILRTENAPVVAAAAVLYHYGIVG
ncbi:MAG TPA: RsmE family RNA methyltransferase [Actinomycetota bacterium]|jgi:16S rRNA (uracil1498-N3)-methyltransferase|nr:RsmE family RNA methyltransferase [Actinomycetota bacterium]